MRNPIFFFLAIAHATPAFAAGFSGHWTATTGTVSSNVGLHSTCTQISIDITEAPGQLTISRYHSECSYFGSNWGPDVMTIKEGKVFEGEDEVGTISDDTLLTVSQDGGAAYAFNLKLLKNADGSETLQSYYGVRNSTGAIATEANLTKAAR